MNLKVFRFSKLGLQFRSFCAASPPQFDERFTPYFAPVNKPIPKKFSAVCDILSQQSLNHKTPAVA